MTKRQVTCQTAQAQSQCFELCRRRGSPSALDRWVTCSGRTSEPNTRESASQENKRCTLISACSAYSRRDQCGTTAAPLHSMGQSSRYKSTHRKRRHSPAHLHASNPQPRPGTSPSKKPWNRRACVPSSQRSPPSAMQSLPITSNSTHTSGTRRFPARAPLQRRLKPRARA